jgi:hypothetical protein
VHLALALLADTVSSGGTINVVLAGVLGTAITIILALVIPRMIGQVIPASKVDEVRLQLTGERDLARNEAQTWKTAYEGMQRANDTLAATNRDITQGVALSNAMMSALKQLPAQTPAAPTGSG